VKRFDNFGTIAYASIVLLLGDEIHCDILCRYEISQVNNCNKWGPSTFVSKLYAKERQMV